MEVTGQYCVYLKCDSVLSDETKKKLQIYLSVRRKSGGQECGPLTAVADNYYCVAFKEQKGIVKYRRLSSPNIVYIFVEWLPCH